MEQETFQELALAHVARIAQQLVAVQDKIGELAAKQQRFNNCMTNLEICTENEIIDKLKAVFKKVDSIDQRLLRKQ